MTKRTTTVKITVDDNEKSKSQKKPDDIEILGIAVQKKKNLIIRKKMPKK